MRTTLTIDQMKRWYPCFDVDLLWHEICGESNTTNPEVSIANMPGKMTPEQLVWVVMRSEILEDNEMLTLSAWMASTYNAEDKHDPLQTRIAAWNVIKIGAETEQELKDRWDGLNVAIFNRIQQFAS